MPERIMNQTRRLSDRILAALELALEQGNLEAAEHLKLALEEVMTAFGGPESTDQRDLPPTLIEALDRLEALRRERAAAPL
jgi:hypothetical protein